MTISPILTLLRPHQWVKNVFIFPPLFFTPQRVSLESVIAVSLGFACFCAISSAVYIINDFADRASDRQHPEKCMRPLAAGTVSVRTALTLALVLGAAAMVGAYALAPGFFLVVVTYLLLNLAYTFAIKHVSILDVFVIALSFILRLKGGAIIVDVQPSVWIIVCTGLLAMFLAIGKRRDDLVRILDQGHRGSLAGYNIRYLDTASGIVLGALFVAYTIYTTDTAVMHNLGTDQLYLTVPFVLAGILRYLQIMVVEEKSGAPTKVVLHDTFLKVTILGWIATFGLLIYR